MHEFHPPQDQSPMPAQIVNAAITAAETGQMPSFTPESLLATLELDGEEPDQKTLMERFTGGEIGFRTLREIPQLIANAKRLILKTNERTANTAQEAIAYALGGIVTAQVVREGDICPGARDIAEQSTREDIIPTEVKARIVHNKQRSEATIDTQEDGLQQFARGAEVLHAILPQIFQRAMMEGWFEPGEKGGSVIPIFIIDESSSPGHGENT